MALRAENDLLGEQSTCPRWYTDVVTTVPHLCSSKPDHDTVTLNGAEHEKGHCRIVGLDQPDGFLRKQQIIVLASVVSTVAGLISTCSQFQES